MIGKTFGYWTVIGGHPADTPRDPVLLECECVCGNQRYVRLTSLNRGISKRCSRMCPIATISDFEKLWSGADSLKYNLKYNSLDKWTEKFKSDIGFNPVKATPCDCVPGSKNKIEEMKRRLEAGEELFSDQDPHSVEDLSQSAKMDSDNIFNLNYNNRRRE